MLTLRGYGRNIDEKHDVLGRAMHEMLLRCTNLKRFSIVGHFESIVLGDVGYKDQFTSVEHFTFKQYPYTPSGISWTESRLYELQDDGRECRKQQTSTITQSISVINAEYADKLLIKGAALVI